MAPPVCGSPASAPTARLQQQYPARGVSRVNVACLVATGVNADRHREILGLDVCSVESHAGWLRFFRGLTARGLSGVSLVTSDAHPGLVAAVAATLAGASWQRCRTHYAANLMQVTPKSSWGWVKALLHSVYSSAPAANPASRH